MALPRYLSLVMRLKLAPSQRNDRSGGSGNVPANPTLSGGHGSAHFALHPHRLTPPLTPAGCPPGPARCPVHHRHTLTLPLTLRPT